MNYKSNFYILLTILIISILSILAFYLINHDKNTVDNNSVKISFTGSNACTSELDYLKMSRKFKTYSLNADTLNDLLMLKSIRKDLNQLKQSFDSVNGIRITFTNEMPYKYYLELVKICLEKKPKYFVPADNEIYAIAKSVYQMKDDSLTELSNDRLQMEIVIEK